MTDAVHPPAGAPPAKADPETLVLRGAPGRVTRFRRGAIVAVAAAGSIAIAGAAWLALKPASFTLVAASDDKVAGAKPPPDALAGAPLGYGDVPRLGPPLPGDLGRPILDRQRQMGLAPGEPADEAARRAAQEAEAERQRLAAEARAARESGVMLQARGEAASAPAATVSVAAAPETALPLSTPAPAPAPAAPEVSGQARKAALVGRAHDAADTNPHALAAPASPWTLQAGSIIAASLVTGLNSDLPGLVTAQVTENVYDSVTGRSLLIPQGSRLIGRYDSDIAFGQSRALVVWQRIILPDGSSIRIDNMPATDAGGYAGLSDRIDRHGWQLLKGVALSTLLGVGSELSFGSSESDLVRALRESAQQGGARAGDQLVSRNLDIPPTLRVRPGWPLRVVVHSDIVLRPWEARGD
ncbi:MAG: TrbI/VirB10 family protein [Sphingopyxis sp.]|nr:TrbI/VirB10 family protein [Sphingopyxis sp.]